ncbi:MAG: hypothetical protein ABIJ18_01295 [archaeon]
MRKIIIIGTLHAGLTSKNELQKILEKINPDQLLVEIAEEDIKNGKFDLYPPEMIFAYKWGKKRRINVNGFDSKINVIRKGLTEEDNQQVIKEQKKLMQNLNWKDMNKSKNLKKIKTNSSKKLIDPIKEAKRESELLKNIKKTMIPDGIITIITGCGHLDFFSKHIKGAILPLRSE